MAHVTGNGTGLGAAPMRRAMGVVPCIICLMHNMHTHIKSMQGLVCISGTGGDMGIEGKGDAGSARSLPNRASFRNND